MKIIFGLQALFGIYYLFYECSRVEGQYAEDVTKNFVPLKFAHVHRGSFNISNCVRELLNCWEVIKPDLVCTGAILFESVCGVVRHQCTDARYWVSRAYPHHEYLLIKNTRDFVRLCWHQYTRDFAISCDRRTYQTV